MGSTLTPGLSMSISRKLIPSWGLPEPSVRTRQNILLANWAWVCHSFDPLTTYSSPSRSALSFRLARSEPDPGSEKPWHQ